MKKIVSTLLALTLLLSLCTFSAFAASASFSLGGSGSVTVGNQIRVTVSLSATEKIGSWRFSLSYDPAYLEYVSGADSGGGGAVSFADSSDGITSLSKTVTFRAKKIGKVTVSVSSAQVVGFDSASNMSVNTPSKSISIVAAPTLSGERGLSALTVSHGELTPAFDPATTAYTLTLPFEITSLTVSATPKDTKASTAVTGADALVVGENKVEVVVTAENGSTRTYTVTVTRQESELAGVTATLDGVTYQIAHDPATLTLPETYSAGTSTFGDRKILTYASPKETLRIAYLYTEESGAWYLYDEKTETFSPYRTLSGTVTTLVILTPDEKTEIPAGFTPAEIAVGEETVAVFAASESKTSGVYLVYGMKPDGDLGFFYFDSALQSFTAYFDPADPALEAEREREQKNLQTRLEKMTEKADLYEILTLALAIVSLLLCIGLILSLVLRKKKGKKEKKVESVIETETEKATQPETELAPAAPVRRRARRTLEEISFKSEEKERAPAPAEPTPADIPDILGLDSKK